MAQERTRKIAIAGALSAVTILLGITHWGYITWFSAFSFTIMAIPVIIGAVLEGPLVGLAIGLIFGLTSMLQAAIAPTAPGDTVFTNPLISVLPRLCIGPIAWLVWNGLKKLPVIGLILAGLAGSLTNTALVLGMLGLFKIYPWPLIGASAVTNGLPEAAIAAVLTLVIVGVTLQLQIGKKKGADL